MRSTNLKAFALSAVLIGLAGVSHAQWVAVNDVASGPGTAANVTRYHPFGYEDGSSGPLRDANTGATLPATLTISKTGFVNLDQYGAVPPNGSSLYNTFVGLVDFAGNTTNNNVGVARGPIPTAGTVTYTISGLNPARKYILQGGAVRGDASYTNRWTLFELAGSDGFVKAHKGGLTTTQVPAIAANQVAINTGIRTGDMFEWQDVNPGTDGSVQIICKVYTNSVPGGSSGGSGAYALTALRIQEAVLTAPTIVVQPQSAVANLGQSATFTIGAVGYPLNYQWLRNGATISGATNSSYTIQSVSGSDENVAFSCRVSNQLGTVTSEEAFVIILKPPIQLVPFNKTWRYWATGSANLGTSWREVGFGDSAWPSGAGALGFETATLPVPIATSFTGDGRITYYFRTTFNFTNEPTDVALVFTNELDDGAVFYLNGTEVLRVGMPEGPVDSTTAAGRTVGDATTFDVNTVPSTELVKGTNVLAVEVHQINSTSSDLVFGSCVWTTNLPPGPLTITSQPQDLTIEELKEADFNVEVNGNGARFQWYKNGEAIAGATRSTLSIPGVVAADQGEYTVRVRNAFSSLTSQTAILTVIPDTNGPVMLEADGSISTTNILISFSEKLTDQTATNRGNYRLTTTAMSPNLTVISAVVTNGTNVLLWTAARSSGTNYLLIANNLRDISPQANLITANSSVPVLSIVQLLGWYDAWYVYDPFIPFDPAYPGDGWNGFGFNTAGWANGGGPFVYNAPQNELPVPPQPLYFSLSQGSITKYFRTTFNYSASLLGASFRMRHMVDDGVIMYLNGQEFVRYNMPAGTVDPNTPGTPEVGAANLVDVLDIPTGGLRTGTNLLAVELHGRSASDLDWIFGLEFNVKVKSFSYGPVVITRQPQSQTVMEGQRVTFSFDGAGPNKFQWYRNGQAIPGATNSTYTILSTPLSYSSSTFYVKAQNLAINTATSSNAVLTVLPDTVRPLIVSAFATTSLNAISLNFNEYMDPVTATQTGNYVITNSTGGTIAVSGATLTNGTNVLLTTGPLPLGSAVLVVNNVRDVSLAGNVILPGSAVRIGYQGAILSRSAVWKYDQSRRDFFAENAWITLGFSASDWLTGTNVFSYPANEGMPTGWAVETALGFGATGTLDYITNYYFRTILNLPGGITGTVTVTNILDDGAVFYLNGREVARFRVTTGPTVTTFSGGRTDDVGTAANPYDVFTVDGTNFVAGDNIIAATAHQSSYTSTDIVFGSEWFLSVPSVVIPGSLQECPDLQIALQGNQVVISWVGGAGCTLQQATALLGLDGQLTQWTAVPSQTNPYRVTLPGGGPVKFYRLAQ